jgi:hypothetical protein
MAILIRACIDIYNHILPNTVAYCSLHTNSPTSRQGGMQRAEAKSSEINCLEERITERIDATSLRFGRSPDGENSDPEERR